MSEKHEEKPSDNSIGQSDTPSSGAARPAVPPSPAELRDRSRNRAMLALEMSNLSAVGHGGFAGPSVPPAPKERKSFSTGPNLPKISHITESQNISVGPLASPSPGAMKQKMQMPDSIKPAQTFPGTGTFRAIADSLFPNPNNRTSAHRTYTGTTMPMEPISDETNTSALSKTNGERIVPVEVADIVEEADDMDSSNTGTTLPLNRLPDLLDEEECEPLSEGDVIELPEDNQNLIFIDELIVGETESALRQMKGLVIDGSLTDYPDYREAISKGLVLLIRSERISDAVKFKEAFAPNFDFSIFNEYGEAVINGFLRALKSGAYEDVLDIKQYLSVGMDFSTCVECTNLLKKWFFTFLGKGDLSRAAHFLEQFGEGVDFKDSEISRRLILQQLREFADANVKYLLEYFGIVLQFSSNKTMDVVPDITITAQDVDDEVVCVDEEGIEEADTDDNPVVIESISDDDYDDDYDDPLDQTQEMSIPLQQELIIESGVHGRSDVTAVSLVSVGDDVLPNTNADTFVAVGGKPPEFDTSEGTLSSPNVDAYGLNEPVDEHVDDSTVFEPISHENSDGEDKSEEFIEALAETTGPFEMPEEVVQPLNIVDSLLPATDGVDEPIKPDELLDADTVPAEATPTEVSQLTIIMSRAAVEDLVVGGVQEPKDKPRANTIPQSDASAVAVESVEAEIASKKIDTPTISPEIEREEILTLLRDGLFFEGLNLYNKMSEGERSLALKGYHKAAREGFIKLVKSGDFQKARNIQILYKGLESELVKDVAIAYLYAKEHKNKALANKILKEFRMEIQYSMLQKKRRQKK